MKMEKRKGMNERDITSQGTELVRGSGEWRQTGKRRDWKQDERLEERGKKLEVRGNPEGRKGKREGLNVIGETDRRTEEILEG